MHGEWRDWTYAEYAKVPLENCFPLDEARLLGSVETGGLGYSLENLTQIPRLLVPHGGLADIKLQAGETIIIAPATGMFGGRAVEVALAMGAKVSFYKIRLSKIRVADYPRSLQQAATSRL
jgi:NADPH:quinone reductase-like Zn-dependent oxidoreductase